MMSRFPSCRSTAFVEAGVVLRLPAIFSLKSSRVEHSAADRSSVRRPRFPLFPPLKSFRHTRAEGQRYIQSP